MRERPHKHEIELSQEQRFVLLQLISSGKAPLANWLMPVFYSKLIATLLVPDGPMNKSPRRSR